MDVSGTAYDYAACCSSITKTGAITMEWTPSTAPSYEPAIKHIYINGSIRPLYLALPVHFTQSLRLLLKITVFM